MSTNLFYFCRVYINLANIVKHLHLRGVYLGVKTCEVFLCFVAIVRGTVYYFTSLFSLFYVTSECHRFLH